MGWWSEDTPQKIQQDEDRKAEALRNGRQRAAEDALGAGKTTEQLRQLKNRDERRKEAREFGDGMRETIRQYIAKTEGFIPCPQNLENISRELESICELEGGDLNNFTTHQLFRAIDKTWDKGRLVFRGPYTRLMPSETELYSMPLNELLELERENRNS